MTGNQILEMLDFYHVNGVIELTEEQLKEYKDSHGIVDDDSDIKIYEPHTVTADSADRLNH